MPGKSWLLDRRTLLQGTGVAMALPLLECMSASAASQGEQPRRMAAVYVPYGVDMEAWTPAGDGADFAWSPTLEPLAPLRSDVTVLGGLLNPIGLNMAGHRNSHIFLRGTERVESIDQFVAERVGVKTRFPSLSLSSDGGIGNTLNLPHTLSFTRDGNPVPSMHRPRQIFNLLFGDDGQNEATRRRELQQTASILDRVREDSSSLKLRLGKQDQRKLNEYLDSVRGVEQEVKRAEHWLTVAKPKVDPEGLALEADPESPKEFIRVMYDLMFLALQTDSTRCVTYMLGSMEASKGVAGTFPGCIGLEANWHKLAHRNKNAPFDRFLVSELARFLQRLKTTAEGDHTLLDQTMVLYGSSNSRTHHNYNYPLVLAGGSHLGLKHGRHLTFDRVPMANLLVTMLGCLGLEVPRYADSNGNLAELTA